MMLKLIPILDLKKQFLLDFRLNFVTKQDKIITLIPLVACLILETLLSGYASSLVEAHAPQESMDHAFRI